MKVISDITLAVIKTEMQEADILNVENVRHYYSDQ